MTRNFYGNCWPKNQHLWLMQAALLEGEPARQALEKWTEKVDIDKLDYPSYQIIPKLYKNLMKLKLSHPAIEVFKGIYQKTWTQNQRSFYLFSNLARELHETGLKDIVLLKGGAMILSCYQDAGIRIMGDIDFLVAKEFALAAMLKLIDLGFKPSPMIPTDPEYLQDKIKMQHGINFIGSGKYDKLCVDIHWSILYDIPSDHIDSSWIQNSDARDLHAVTISTLNATDLLYQTCVHGAKYSPVPLTRWVMDAVTLIHLNGEQINWETLIHYANRDRLVWPIYNAFQYLIKHFAAPIPKEVMRKLQKSPIFIIEKLHFTLRQSAFFSLLLIPPRLWRSVHKTSF